MQPKQLGAEIARKLEDFTQTVEKANGCGDKISQPGGFLALAQRIFAQVQCALNL